jgi:phosphatidylglycerol---prolipoprotein diacylglyceryl transferase
MHFPVYLGIGPVILHPHWVFEALAYLIGARVYAHLRARSGDPLAPTDRWWIVAAACLGAALGSKLIVIPDHPTLVLQHLAEPLSLLDGKSVVGGLVGALIAVEWTKRRIGVTRATGDQFAFPVAVGIAIGRVGCFLTGLEDNTHGLPATLPWAMDFGDGVPRHPAQLYEIAFVGLVLVPTLVWLARRQHREGDLFKLFMVGYLGFRLGLEFLKPGDPIGGLTAIQWISLGALVWYAHYLPERLRRPQRVVLAGG